jgi:hypothetical protein
VLIYALYGIFASQNKDNKRAEDTELTDHSNASKSGKALPVEGPEVVASGIEGVRA